MMAITQFHRLAKKIRPFLNSRASISSWTKIKLGNVELQIQQQFSSPPGKAMLDTTGQRIWPTAGLLLEEIVKETCGGDEKTIKVLELGAGCGLVGMGLAASSQRYQVIMTDQPASIEWLERNVHENQHLFEKDQIQIAALTWGNSKDHERLKEVQLQHRTVDWIVGSDLLYNPIALAPLVSTLQEFACPDKTKILLTYPKRQKDEELFLPQATERGFQVDITPLQGGREDVEYSLAKLHKLS